MSKILSFSIFESLHTQNQALLYELWKHVKIILLNCEVGGKKIQSNPLSEKKRNYFPANPIYAEIGEMMERTHYTMQSIVQIDMIVFYRQIIILSSKYTTYLN